MRNTMPSIAVVMPFYKNSRTLEACLRSFTQQVGACATEIVVVDDGAESCAQDIVDSAPWPIPVRVLRTVRLGQSAATNAGILAAQADIIMLTCADIIATPTLLQHHLRAHNQADDIGVFGHIDYAPWLPATPIMDYLAQPKVQFDFAAMASGQDVPGAMLYAPNVSVGKKQLLQAGLFDEALTYGYQDCDLGLKLAAQGMRFVYCPEARVLHDHPNTIQGFLDRQYRVNTLWPIMARRYPQFANLEQMTAHLDHFVPMIPLLGGLQQVAERANKQDLSHVSDDVRTRLFALFGTLGSLAMVRGMVADLDALGQVMDITQRPWCAQLDKMLPAAPARVS